MHLGLLGYAFGIVASLGITRWMRSMLFEVSHSDPVTFASVFQHGWCPSEARTWLVALTR